MCRIAPADSDEAINAALAGCPDGSTVRFPANATYHQDDSIILRNRSNLTVDGNGSTFVNSAPNTKKTQTVNWRVFQGRNVTLKNMTAVGQWRPVGPISMETVENEGGACEFNSGFVASGGDGISFIDLEARELCGDGFGAYWSHYFDDTVPAESPRNIRMTRVRAETVARVCFGPTQVVGLWIEDSSCKRAFYGGLDAEIDRIEDLMQDVHILRNTFEDYSHFAIMVPLAGAPDGSTRNIEIRGNRILTAGTNVCAAPITVGAYPAVTRRFHNVVIEDNDVTAVARGILYDHVDGGSVRNNRVRRVPAPMGHTAAGWCGEDRPVISNTSAGVVIADNTVVT